MKILMLSMASPHFFNWTQQLEDSGHEVYWLDVFDSNTHVENIDFAEQITGWRYKWDFRGRYFIKKYTPVLNSLINRFNERDLKKVFEEKLKEIQPDIVHSFVMQSSCFSILDVMNRFPQIKWLYSSWGSDVFYYYNKGIDTDKMKRVLKRMNFIFTDCLRDYNIIQNLGFEGQCLGVIPGGGGFNFLEMDPFMKPFSERKIILIKGYQGKHGRCIQVLLALPKLQLKLKSYKIVVFGAHDEVKEFVLNSELKDWDNLEVKGKITRHEVLKLMGDSKIYIGNSLSDGMPNTLLEALVMGAFPIQSNPGGVSEEVISNGINGLIINKPEDSEEIKKVIIYALEDVQTLLGGISYNQAKLKPKLERNYVKKKVLESYSLIENEI